MMELTTQVFWASSEVPSPDDSSTTTVQLPIHPIQLILVGFLGRKWQFSTFFFILIREWGKGIQSKLLKQFFFNIDNFISVLVYISEYDFDMKRLLDPP